MDEELSDSSRESSEESEPLKVPSFIYGIFFGRFWWNPAFYISILVILFSCLSIAAHMLWRFPAGTFLALLAVGFSTFVIVKVVQLAKQPLVFYDYVEVFLFSFIILGVLAIFAGVVWGQVILLRIHFDSEEPVFVDFPTACRPNDYDVPIQNCVRVGKDIPNPMAGVAINVPTFSTSLSNVQNAFEIVMSYRIRCTMLETQRGLTHYRCLTRFAGYPDDLVVKLFCDNNNQTVVWIHSQSRLGVWDKLYNEYRVRLLTTIINREYRNTLPRINCAADLPPVLEPDAVVV